MKKLTLALLVAAIGITACENDTDGSDNRPAVPFSKIQLSENSPAEAGVPTVTTTQTYLYDRGMLTGSTTVQSYSVQGETMKIENYATVTYDGQQAVVTDNFGNVSTYLLNDRGYAVQCTRQEAGTTRTYTFSYFDIEGKCYLKHLAESINGEPYASIDIDYSNLRALRIVQHTDTYEQAYTAASYNGTPNRSEVPALFLTSLYPLSLHTAALYGKLLGEPFEVLTDEIIPDGNTESREVTRYTYSFDGRNLITSCKEVTNSYGTSYTRTVNYTIE
ncbi:DUF4595 domain-containing protein [Bacteroides gallinarum]|uniref:DUF4595 domain-containing protein n=1 Tax=Bacteroides gallinarum TaxID=376806 RepID=UPI00037E76B0|nr:DUF4595 domain-containing protein [Bacteroides gallinarum]